MNKYGDYLWTIEERDGQYRALVFEAMGEGRMDAVARSNFRATMERALEKAQSIMDRAMAARDYE